MSIQVPSDARLSGVFSDDTKVVIVHDGRRGAQGVPGDQGDQGDQGDSIVVHGTWVPGTTYCPLDAVSWRSRLYDHINSLYVQLSTVGCSPSTTEPHLDTTRWTEIGAVDWDNAFGGIWTVYQEDHPFTRIGEPAGYSFQSDNYVLADCRLLDELAIAVVREVIDKDRVVLQSSGEVPNIDAAVIYPTGTWEPGRTYYVSTVRGRLERYPPADTNFYANPILKVTDAYGSQPNPSGRNGVALPWTPAAASAPTLVPAGKVKFFYTAVGGETSVSGPDDNGNTLAYYPGPNTDVFQDGLNLYDGVQYTATDGTSVDFTTPLSAGDIVEIWTTNIDPDVLIPSTVLKLDNIESGFDGSTTDFPLSSNAVTINVQASVSFLVWLDAFPQEAEVDYTVLEDPNDPGSDKAIIRFTMPIPSGTRFWGIAFAPSAPSP